MNSSSPWINMDVRAWQPICKPEHMLRLPRQSYLFHQGDSVQHVFIIKSGRVLVSVIGHNGKEWILMFITNGGILGEKNLFTPAEMDYSAQTVSDVVLYKIPLQDFRDRVLSDLTLLRHVMQMQQQKESCLISHLVKLSFCDAYHRAVHELLIIAEMYGERIPEGILLKIPISQEGLGKRIQTSRITVSKVMKRLAEEGLVGRKGQNFVLLDMESLIAIDGEKL